MIMAVKTGSDDMTRGVLGGLGTLFIEIVYIILAVIIGINLIKRGSFYGFMKNVGEGDKTNSQIANVIGIVIYGLIVFLLLPIIKALAARIFGV